MLYHKDVFLPRRLVKQLPKNVRKLNYSSHAKNEVKSDRYGQVNVPSEIIFQDWEVIEIESKDGIISDKVVLRKKYDDRDLCIVVLVKCNTVKTVWINLNSDKHSTLDISRYVQRA